MYLIECRAFLMKCRAFLIECRAFLVEYIEHVGCTVGTFHTMPGGFDRV